MTTARTRSSIIGVVLTVLFTSAIPALAGSPSRIARYGSQEVIARRWNTTHARPTVRSIKRDAQSNSPLSELSAIRYQYRPAHAVVQPDILGSLALRTGVVITDPEVDARRAQVVARAMKCYETHTVGSRLARCLHDASRAR